MSVPVDHGHPAVQDAVVDEFQVAGCHVREGRLATGVPSEQGERRTARA